MALKWTPSGPTVKCTASASTLFNFTSQVEGVAALVNVGTTTGFATLQNAANSLPNNTMPIVAGATLFAAFGAQQNNLKITGAEIDITPGYALKDKEQQNVSIPAFIQDLNPLGLWLMQPQYLFTNAAGTTPVVNDGDTIQFIRDLSGNSNHLTKSTTDCGKYRKSNGLTWAEYSNTGSVAISPFGLNIGGINGPFWVIYAGRVNTIDISSIAFIKFDGNVPFYFWAAPNTVGIGAGGGISIAASPVVVGADFVAANRWAAPAAGILKANIDNGAYATTTNTTGNASPFNLFQFGDQFNTANVRIYGAFLGRSGQDLTDGQAIQVSKFLAYYQGRAI